MYEITANGATIYSPKLASFGYVVTSPTITKEVNRAGSLEFTMAPGHPNYNNLQKLKTIIRVFQNGIEIWRGRVLSTETNFYREKKVVCEGELAFMNDTLVPPYDYSDGIALGDFFTFLVSSYSSSCSSDKIIRPGNITNMDASTRIYDYSDDYQVTLTALTNKLVDEAGGYLSIRRENGVTYLDYLDVFSNNCGQSIEFGKNLLDITESIDASEVYTILLPFGAEDEDGNKITVESVNNGSKYITNSTAVDIFGPITRTADYSDAEDPSTLYTEAVSDLNKAIQAATTITVKAIDLKLIGVDTDRIDVGSIVTVISPPHGINDSFLCSQVSIDLESPDNTSYTLGLATSSLTEKQFKKNIKDREEIEDEIDESSEETLEDSKSYTDKLWHEVTTSEEEFKVEYGQKITEIEDSITTVTEDVATLTVRADNLNSTISQTKTELEGDVEKSKTELQSQINQTAAEIYTKVSSVQTTAEDAETTANEAYSEAIQAYNKISLVVSSGSSSSTLTLTPEMISLISSQVQINSPDMSNYLTIQAFDNCSVVAPNSGSLQLGNANASVYVRNILETNYFYAYTQIRSGGNCVVDNQLSATSGIFSKYCYAPSWTQGSDRRLKEDVAELQNESMETLIYGLKPVQYRYKDPIGGALRFGFIAQDVRETLDSLGYTEDGTVVSLGSIPGVDEERYSLDYTTLIAPLVSTVQALHKEVEELKQEVENLKKGESK